MVVTLVSTSAGSLGNAAVAVPRNLVSASFRALGLDFGPAAITGALRTSPLITRSRGVHLNTPNSTVRRFTSIGRLEACSRGWSSLINLNSVSRSLPFQPESLEPHMIKHLHNDDILNPGNWAELGQDALEMEDALAGQESDFVLRPDLTAGDHFIAWAIQIVLKLRLIELRSDSIEHEPAGLCEISHLIIRLLQPELLHQLESGIATTNTTFPKASLLSLTPDNPVALFISLNFSLSLPTYASTSLSSLLMSKCYTGGSSHFVSNVVNVGLPEAGPTSEDFSQKRLCAASCLQAVHANLLAGLVKCGSIQLALEGLSLVLGQTGKDHSIGFLSDTSMAHSNHDDLTSTTYDNISSAAAGYNHLLAMLLAATESNVSSPFVGASQSWRWFPAFWPASSRAPMSADGFIQQSERCRLILAHLIGLLTEAVVRSASRSFGRLLLKESIEAVVLGVNHQDETIKSADKKKPMSDRLSYNDLYNLPSTWPLSSSAVCFINQFMAIDFWMLDASNRDASAVASMRMPTSPLLEREMNFDHLVGWADTQASLAIGNAAEVSNLTE
ncbi:unnamed protein product [Protopolystoma xenopodis]|uniref:Uncharacterized protein n=1 Tax=Protopolystoma xenopodis TaxID=117903 RepID=A0A448XCN0_9PLAT|nr:unnamed protein product [Protopolystoma xenopodis]